MVQQCWKTVRWHFTKLNIPLAYNPAIFLGIYPSPQTCCFSITKAAENVLLNDQTEAVRCYGLTSLLSPSPLFTERFAHDPKGTSALGHGYQPAHCPVLLHLPQVLQYRSWCQELEKRLEATGVSKAVLCSSWALEEYG